MNRDEVAKLDKTLLNVFVATRPTFDKPGVYFQCFLDDGSRPLKPDSGVTGRLNIDQAKGVIRDLELMIKISEGELG